MTDWHSRKQALCSRSSRPFVDVPLYAATWVSPKRGPIVFWCTKKFKWGAKARIVDPCEF